MPKSRSKSKKLNPANIELLLLVALTGSFVVLSILTIARLQARGSMPDPVPPAVEDLSHGDAHEEEITDEVTPEEEL